MNNATYRPVSYTHLDVYKRQLIYRLAPCNNAAVHYSYDELKVAHKAVMKRLCLYDLVVLILLLLQVPSVAATLVVAETAVASLVVLAKLGVGIQ